jgi:hypothetical protein
MKQPGAQGGYPESSIGLFKYVKKGRSGEML